MLLAAIDDLAAPIAANGASVDVDVPASAKLPPGVEALIFRTVQEGLRNAARHSHAKNISVAVRIGRDSAEASVADDGEGFDPGRRPPGGHLGLRLLEDLARDAGGRLTVDSGPGEGTRLKLEVPT